MVQDFKLSVIRDILPNVGSNAEIEALVEAPGLKPLYEMNLKDPMEREAIVTIRNTLLQKSDKEKKPEDLSAAALANVFYYDLCDKQASSIAAELISNDEIGMEFYTSIFVKLVENYQSSEKEFVSQLAKFAGENTGKELLDDAKDIIFVQRFSSFYRYDKWSISDPENKDMISKPDRVFLALLNNDLCLGAFWDETVSLKNSMVHERIQTLIDEMLTTDFDAGAMVFLNAIGQDNKTILSGEHEKSLLHLIEIAQGDSPECSMFSFKYDPLKLDELKAKVLKTFSDPMIKIKGFMEMNKVNSTKSLDDLVAELKKLKGQENNGATIKSKVPV